MFKGQLQFSLSAKGQRKGNRSKNPNLKMVFSKLVLGVIFLTFSLTLSPAINFPPHSAVVKAQAASPTPATQTEDIKANSIPLTFQLPHPGYLSTPFSIFHPGIDIATGLGMPINPVAPGVVTQSGYNFWGLGLTVTVDHGYGYSSVYAHMGKTYVQVGQTVSDSDLLGEVGLTGNTTGPHTHLEIIKDGVKINPSSVLPAIRTYPKSEDFTAQPSASSSAVIVASPSAYPVKVYIAPTPTPTPSPTAVPTATPLPEFIPIKKEATINLPSLMTTIDTTSENNKFSGGSVIDLSNLFPKNNPTISTSLINQTLDSVNLNKILTPATKTNSTDQASAKTTLIGLLKK